MAGAAVAAVAVVPLLAGCGRSPETPLTQIDRGVVASVVDGDTLRLRDGRRIRLVQIDAPEARTDCYGRAATRALAALTPPGATVALRSDPALDDADAGGRLLRYVRAGAVNVNLRLVEDGAAAPYFFRNARGRYAEALLDAARGARRARLGLWGACPGAQLKPGLGSVTGRR